MAAGVLLLAILPGMHILRTMRIGQQWDLTGRFVLGTAVSLAVVPVVLNLLWHITNDGGVLLGVWAVLLGAAVLLWAGEPRLGSGLLRSAGCYCCLDGRRFFEHRATKWFALFVSLVVMLATIGSYWPTELPGFPVPSSIHDFIKHHAVLDSLSRQPLPLGNVFYADGAAGPTYYYHFFYLVPATLHAWSGADNELCFGIASCLGALSLTGLVYMTVKRLKGGEAPATLAVALVTVVGALDVFPLAVDILVGRRGMVVTLDAWADNVYRIHSFLNQMMWTPQNVQGVLVTMVGVTLLSHYGLWRGWFIWGPMLGASLIGSSVWVALGVMPAVAVWSVLRLVELRHDRRAAVRLLFALMVVAELMLLCAAPSVYGYLETSARHGKSLTMLWTPRTWAFFGQLTGPGIPANILDLPITLTFELGGKVLFLFGVGAVIWRRAWHDLGLRLLWICSIVAIIGSVTIRSHFYYNDFGQKVMMLPMAFGAVLGACILDSDSGTRRWWNPLGWRLDSGHIQRHRRLVSWLVGLVIVAGLPMGFYEVPLTAARRYIEVRHVPVDERAALCFMRHQLPPEAVVQADWRKKRATLAQTIRRQIGVMADQDDILVFRPADWEAYQQAVADVERALQETESSAEAHSLLASHGITHVYVGAIERKLWKHLEKLDDRSRFQPLFEAGAHCIYELTGVGDQGNRT